MKYSEFIEKIRPYSEEKFACFQKKLIFTKYEIMGIRTPILRKLAKEISEKVSIQTLFSYPNKYYEVVFIKLTVASRLPYEQFLEYVESCVELMDNWALCDCFKAKCIRRHKEEFLSVLESLFSAKKEYYVRYTLVVLLAEYVQEEYLAAVISFIRKTAVDRYYVHMAVAWLTAEILVKYYEEGVAFLQEGILPVKTHNKAIQKAIESYRISMERKEALRSLKIKKER